MDLRTVVTISALLLMTAESNAQINGTNSPEITSPTETSIITTCPCPSDTSAQTTPSSRSSTPVLVLLTVKWTKTCEGNVEMLYYPSNSTPMPVCYSSKANVSSLLSKVCEMRNGCEKKLHLKENKKQDGYDIAGKGVEETIRCTTLMAQCADTADVQGQLRAYKVVTALLCCVLVVLFLIRFTRPTVKALQKRLSDRRQNRWIGPTQSHSVSYHRGKTAVKNNEGEKRLSYPALERLTVSDSREPSSNRNSDYNL